MKIKNKYVFFWTGDDFFSNFYLKEFKDESGTLWQCSEQLFMFYKAMFFNDQETALLIKNLTPNTKEYFQLAKRFKLSSTKPESFPLICKKLGREVKNFNSTEWDNVSFEIMVETVKQKFINDPELKNRLKNSTGFELIEASPYDRIWGIGFGYQNALANKANWGKNQLGLALTKLRAEL